MVKTETTQLDSSRRSPLSAVGVALSTPEVIAGLLLVIGFSVSAAMLPRFLSVDYLLDRSTIDMEAGLLAAWMSKLSLTHLHNHFADSSCSVAAIAAEIGGFSFSFTTHGPA